MADEAQIPELKNGDVVRFEGRLHVVLWTMTGLIVKPLEEMLREAEDLVAKGERLKVQIEKYAPYREPR